MSKIKDDHKTTIIILFIIGSLIGVGVGFLTMKAGPEAVIQYYGFLFTIFAVWRGTIHFRAYHDMERRKIAITESRTLQKECKDALEVLKEAFDLISIGEKAIPVEKIHKKICKLDEKEKPLPDPDNHDRMLLDYDGEGIKIQKSIVDVLNTYEYLAVGVNQKIFDKAVILELNKGNFVKIYKNFKPYIDHFNDDMYPSRKGAVWINMVTLAKELLGEAATATKKGAADD